jgi:hypothetical protein
MKKYWIIPIVCLAFASCKKQAFSTRSVLDFGHSNLKSLAHPLSYCNDGIPIGGGEGYNSIVGSKHADIVISVSMTAASFKTLIESSANKIIYIQSNVVIDLTGLTSSIMLPPNITIASNRGVGSSLGALIKTDDVCFDGGGCSFPLAVFLSNGNNIRVTGIRLQGPFNLTTAPGGIRVRAGILMKGYDGLEVDNCELSAWPYAAVAIGQNQDPTGFSNNNNRIHHNHIHSNKQNGYGYGVAVNNGFALIQANTFQGNRHDIACSGSRNTNNTGYEASCNISLGGGTGHNFDVHGENGDNLPNASTFFYIHHNYFMDLGEQITGTDPKQNIIIRGRPDNQCRIENNIFKQDGPAQAIKQQSYGSGASSPNSVGNMLVWNNVYGYNLNGAPGSYLGWYVKPTWSKKGVSNFVNLASSNDQLMATIGGDNIVDYTFGDYDGDGKTDIYKIHNGALYVMPYEVTNGLIQGWTQIATISYVMNQLRFGHYNSDNKTDVITKDFNNIYISYGCNTPWVLMASTSYPMSSIYSGDLTGDGIEDFFTSDAGSFWMRNNAIPGSSWTAIATSGANISSLKLGWFDLNTADNKIDVFYANGSTFQAGYNGTQWWTTLANSTYTAPNLYICDFDSDGVSDVVNSSMQIALKGRMSWANNTLNNFPLSTFTYGDFN